MWEAAAHEFGRSVSIAAYRDTWTPVVRRAARRKADTATLVKQLDAAARNLQVCVSVESDGLCEADLDLLMSVLKEECTDWDRVLPMSFGMKVWRVMLECVRRMHCMRFAWVAAVRTVSRMTPDCDSELLACVIPRLAQQLPEDTLPMQLRSEIAEAVALYLDAPANKSNNDSMQVLCPIVQTYVLRMCACTCTSVMTWLATASEQDACSMIEMLLCDVGAEEIKETGFGDVLLQPPLELQPKSVWWHRTSVLQMLLRLRCHTATVLWTTRTKLAVYCLGEPVFVMALYALREIVSATTTAARDVATSRAAAPVGMVEAVQLMLDIAMGWLHDRGVPAHAMATWGGLPPDLVQLACVAILQFETPKRRELQLMVIRFVGYAFEAVTHLDRVWPASLMDMLTPEVHVLLNDVMDASEVETLDSIGRLVEAVMPFCVIDALQIASIPTTLCGTPVTLGLGVLGVVLPMKEQRVVAPLLSSVHRSSYDSAAAHMLVLRLLQRCLDNAEHHRVEATVASDPLVRLAVTASCLVSTWRTPALLGALEHYLATTQALRPCVKTHAAAVAAVAAVNTTGEYAALTDTRPPLKWQFSWSPDMDELRGQLACMLDMPLCWVPSAEHWDDVSVTYDSPCAAAHRGKVPAFVAARGIRALHHVLWFVCHRLTLWQLSLVISSPYVNDCDCVDTVLLLAPWLMRIHDKPPLLGANEWRREIAAALCAAMLRSRLARLAAMQIIPNTRHVLATYAGVRLVAACVKLLTGGRRRARARRAAQKRN